MFDPLGAAATAQAAAEAFTTGALVNYVQRANNLSDLANAATARTNLGLGTAATHASTDFDAAGAAAAAVTTAEAYTDTKVALYLPLTGGTLSGLLTSSGITDSGPELFGNQTPVNAINTVNQCGIGYAPTNFPAGSTIGTCVAATAPPSGTAGSTFVLFQARVTTNGSNPMSTLQALKFDAICGSSGNPTSAVIGLQGTARMTGGATVPQAQCNVAQLLSSNNSVMTIGYDFLANSPSLSSGGTIGTAYGFYCAGMSVAGVTTGIAFYANNATDTSRLAGSLSVGQISAPRVVADVNGTIATKVYTVATLPAASLAAGQRACVSDASTTVVLGLGLVVVGGGANFTPVYSDGTNWRIG